ncbi:MAG: DNA repair protein RecO [Planctomycetota bacterium]
MPRFKDSAVCLRLVEYSESSQVVVLLTQAHGKVRGLAKGSRRLAPSSIERFSGGMELLHRGQVVATTRPSSELAAITEWDLQDDAYHLRQSLSAQRVALYAADLTHALLADLDPHPETFLALIALLDALKATNEDTQAVALLRFQWALLDDAGYRPVLDHDALHDAELRDAEAYTFDAQAGGFTADDGRSSWRVRHRTLEALRRIATHDGNELDAESSGRANRLLAAYARELIGRELPTMSIALEARHGASPER